MKNMFTLIIGILVAITICNTRFQDFSINLDSGFEESQIHQYHPWDGGMVAVFHEYDGNTMASTGSGWQAQAFYPVPIKDF